MSTIFDQHPIPKYTRKSLFDHSSILKQKEKDKEKIFSQ